MILRLRFVPLSVLDVKFRQGTGRDVYKYINNSRRQVSFDFRRSAACCLVCVPFISTLSACGVVQERRFVSPPRDAAYRQQRGGKHWYRVKQQREQRGQELLASYLYIYGRPLPLSS